MAHSPEKILVLGADAAGMSAAHQALRSARSQNRRVQVIAVERTPYTSYSACGLPYWISGEVPGYEDLVARSPEQHRAAGVDLRMGTRALELDLHRRAVEVNDGSRRYWIDFDQLVIATGASPIMPEWTRDSSGKPVAGIAGLKDPRDAITWIETLTGPQRDTAHPIVIAGGGYIGVEMAEVVAKRGRPVVLITRTRVMSGMEPSMSERISQALIGAGVTIISGDPVVGASAGDDGSVQYVETESGQRVHCSAVLVSMGVRANLDFTTEGDLPMGRSGALLPDERGEVLPGIWAAGDCCEARHRVSGKSVYVPLGTHANKQGRVVGSNLLGGDARFEGVLGTGISRFAAGDFYIEMSNTGLNTSEALAAGFDPMELTTEGRTASGYMDGSAPIAVSIIADRSSRRLLGVQIAGGPNSAKRIDTAAAALWAELKVDDLAAMDLAYAPPFATVWEAVQLAARRLADRLPKYTGKE